MQCCQASEHKYYQPNYSQESPFHLQIDLPWVAVFSVCLAQVMRPGEQKAFSVQCYVNYTGLLQSRRKKKQEQLSQEAVMEGN